MKIDYERFSKKLDLEGKYVDFSLLRLALSVYTLVKKDENIDLTKPTGAGECRGVCPKCGKSKSFALNINTNRFKCFNKGCTLKGGGVIDFAAKLYEISAKEAAHLLACAYGIQPYDPINEGITEDKPNGSGREVQTNGTQPVPEETDTPATDLVTREEFEEAKRKYDNLTRRFERLQNVVFGYMLDQEQNYEEDVAEHLVSH